MSHNLGECASYDGRLCQVCGPIIHQERRRLRQERQEEQAARTSTDGPRRPIDGPERG